MKNKIITLVLFVLLVHTSTNAQSYEIELSSGKDFYEIPNLSTGFNLVDLTEAKIVRDGFVNPFTFGIKLGYFPSKKYIFSFLADFNYKEYLIKYSRNSPKLLDPFQIGTSNYNIPWARLGVFVNLDYIVASYNSFSFLLGGGLGIQIVAPAVSAEFLYKTLLNKISELDISSDVNLNVYFSQKINSGIKYNIDNSNIYIATFASYTFVSNIKFEAPSDFFSLKFIVGYKF